MEVPSVTGLKMPAETVPVYRAAKVTGDEFHALC